MRDSVAGAVYVGTQRFREQNPNVIGDMCSEVSCNDIRTFHRLWRERNALQNKYIWSEMIYEEQGASMKEISHQIAVSSRLELVRAVSEELNCELDEVISCLKPSSQALVRAVVRFNQGLDITALGFDTKSNFLCNDPSCILGSDALGMVYCRDIFSTAIDKMDRYVAAPLNVIEYPSVGVCRCVGRADGHMSILSVSVASVRFFHQEGIKDKIFDNDGIERSFIRLATPKVEKLAYMMLLDIFKDSGYRCTDIVVNV